MKENYVEEMKAEMAQWFPPYNYNQQPELLIIIDNYVECSWENMKKTRNLWNTRIHLYHYNQRQRKDRFVFVGTVFSEQKSSFEYLNMILRKYSFEYVDLNE